MSLITMRSLLVPPSAYCYSLTLSEYLGWKRLVHMRSASTNPVGVLLTIYYVHISHTLYYTILHTIYTTYT
jgi:hypothetical protein